MIFHVATAADWRAARASGSYTTSTRGRTLEQEGFIHCSRADQWPEVHRRWYADVAEPLVLLTVDPARLTSPVVEEPAGAGGAGGETFPHLYGPLPADAVVRAVPLEQALADLGRSFTSIFVGEVVRRMALATGAMALALVGLLVGAVVGSDTGAAVGLLVGLALGVVAVVVVLRRRRSLSRR